MKKILYIAFYFPPLGGVAAIRSAKNVKYLVQLGYEVQVLTVQPGLVRAPKDHTLQQEIPQSVKIWRSFFPDPNWLFKLLYGLRLGSVVRFLRQRVFIPDHECLWLPFARIQIRQIVRQNPDISVAIISSGPPSSLSLGLMLKNKHNIPFICDFRDEWTNNPQRINLSYPARSQLKEQKMESIILKETAGVAFLTSKMQDNFLGRYPFVKSKSWAIIPNGYDEIDFARLEPSTNTEVIHLVFGGSFYDRLQPDPLWHALKQLFDAGDIPPSKIAIDIIGKNTVSFVMGKYSSDPVIPRVVTFQGFLPHHMILQEFMKADVLLLYIPSGKNSDSIMTGKVFDYIRTGKPILAIVPPQGLAAEIVTKAGTGFVVDYQDIQGIAKQVLKLFRMWQGGEFAQITPDYEYISGFSREKLARRLAALVEEVTA